MAVDEKEFEEAEKRMEALRQAGHAVGARYDRKRSRIVVRLNTGLELAFPPALAEGLADATPEGLADIEITPAGLGLHWPKLDADLYIPALLQGVFGSRRWMAAELGAAGGRARSPAKAKSSRLNGRKGGRPRKKTGAGVARMFDISTSRDLLANLDADFDDFMKEPHSARLALNCAITAFHLHEWVWGDWLKTDDATCKTLGIRDKNSFLTWIEKECVWFKTIRDLANGTKHFASFKNFTTERVGAPPFMFDELEAGFGQGAIGGPIAYDLETHGNGCLLIDYGEGAGNHRWRTAAALLDVVVRFWGQFFARYRPDPKVRARIRE